MLKSVPEIRDKSKKLEYPEGAYICMKNNNENNNKPYYLPIFMCIGISIGMAIGAASNNIPIGMCLGLSIGLCLGAGLEAQNRKKEDDSAKKVDEEE